MVNSIQDDINPSICAELDFPSDLNVFMKDESNLSFLNINIRSLRKNFAKLTTFLSQMNYKIKIIIVTETFLKDGENKLFSIKGYNHVSMNRQTRNRGGGVRIYYCDTLSVDVIDKNSGIFESHEALFLSIRTQSMGSMTVGGIYRPPGLNIRKFNQYFKNKIFNSEIDNHCVILGDMNIQYRDDYLTTHNHHWPHLEYFDAFIENNFRFLVDKYTRVVGHNEPSAIDHK